MKWSLPSANFEYRNPGFSGYKRAALVTLAIAAAIGAALAIIIEKPFEGQITAIAVLGLAELLLCVAFVFWLWANWKDHHSPLPSSLVAAYARSQLLSSLAHSSTLLGIVELLEDSLLHIYDNEAASRELGLVNPEAVINGGDAVPKESALERALMLKCRESLASRSSLPFDFTSTEGGKTRKFIGEIVPVPCVRRDLHRFRYSLQEVSDTYLSQESHRLVRQEHAAYQKALKLASSGAHVDDIASALVDAIDTLFPRSCWVILAHDASGAITKAIAGTAMEPGVTLGNLLLSERHREIIAQATQASEQALMAVSSAGLDAECTELLQSLGLSNCLFQVISLSDKRRWGTIVSFLSENPPDPLFPELQLPTQIASTVIERSLLIQQLQDKTERTLLAERAGKIGIWDWDVPTGRLLWSEQMEEINMMPPGTFAGTYDAWKARVIPEDLAKVESELQETFRVQRKDYSATYRLKLPDGRIHWMESLGAIYYDAAGKPVRMVGTQSDVTEKKELLARTEEGRRQLELVLESARLGFWDWHIPSGHVHYGGVWSSMLGYSKDEIPPHVHAWESLVHPDDLPSVMKALNSHFADKSPVYEAEQRLKKKDGSWLWILSRGKVVERDASGAPIRALGIHADISQERVARDSLRQAAKRKDEFLATLAHELRNPLAPLRTGLEIINLEPSGREAERARKMMGRQLVTMVRLIDDLLDVARITQGRLELKKSTVSLTDVIDTALEGVKPAIDAAKLTFSVNVPQQPILLSGDSVRLSQVFMNILGNAVKYTPEGGAISLSAHRTNGTATIEIKDNGLGIPKEMLKAVFDMFGQVNQTLDRSQGGLGIGLAIVKKIVELHGGEVCAESPGVGLGSTFTIHLPVLQEERAQERPKIKKPSPEVEAARGVLVVDDNIDGAESLALFISMLGHRVEVAHSGQEALSLIKRGLPDTIFLDIGLPGLGGYEVAREIRKLPMGQSVTLIALTGWGTEEDKRKAQEAGFTEHLTKPVDLSHIERILGSHKPREPRSEQLPSSPAHL